MAKLSLIISICMFGFMAKGQTVGFTFASGAGTTLCSPAIVNFTQTCTGNPIGYSWYFSNGLESNEPNPSISFAAGTFTAKLVAVFETGPLETTQSFTVNPSISATLTADKNYICLPGNINFTATATGTINNYEWTFGDGANASTSTATTTHAYTTLGSFNASVKVIDASGCSATAAYSIVVQNPPITASVTPVAGCAPANASFNAIVNIPSGSTVTNYNWNFGDASPVFNTTIGNTTHTYIDSGSYIPSVSITTSEGCTNNFTYPTIAFGIPPTNHIAYPKKTVYCGSETAQLVAKANLANAYQWNYGDGIIETITDTLATHKYATLGVKNITVTPFFNGCAGVPISFSIDIVGVIASFTYANTCAAKKTFSFTNTSQGIINSSVWAYGDGSLNGNTFNAVHTFPPAGAFSTTLTVADNATGCSDAISVVIYTANPTLTNTDDLVCRNSPTTFTINNNYTNTNASYEWHLLGLSTIIFNSNPITPSATVFGNYNNNFVIIKQGPQYCDDVITLAKNIAVRGPNLSFTRDSILCAKKVFTITNTSTAYLASDSVKLWYWNYGTAKNDTIFQPATFIYNVAGTYNVKLVAKDKNGCVDSLIKTVTVKQTPFLRVFPRYDTLCQGRTDSLFAFHSDTLLWTPAAFLNCATCDTTIASPISTTIFYATAKNNIGCSITDSSIITVVEPFIASTNSPLFACVGDTVRFGASPFGKKIIWSPGIGLSDSTSYTPLITVQNSNTYFAQLTDSLGCFTSNTSVNLIAKTLPLVNAGADKIVPFNTAFAINPTYGSNIVAYEWLPSTTLSCSNCASPSGVAVDSKNYTIKVTSDSGCVAKDDINIFIECKYANLFLPSAFTPNNDGKNDRYYPITRGINEIVRFTIYNRYGQIVYDAKNRKPNESRVGWDGKFKGFVQPADAYVFVLEAICELGETIFKKDSFLLLK